MIQFAYVGHDGTVRVTASDRTDPQSILPAGTRCTWPTWSPDGSQIAFSGFRSGSNGHGQLGVYLAQVGSADSRQIYTNEPDTDGIARGTPHYILWSPDSQKLAIIAQTRTGGLSLFLSEISNSAPAQRLIDGGPLYASWSPNSRHLLIHSHRDHYLMNPGMSQDLQKMPGTASQYMAPSWSPVSERLAFFHDVGTDQQTLLVGEISSGKVQALADIRGIAALSWGPDGNTIALLRDTGDRSGYYRGLWLLDAAGARTDQATEDPVLACFWSPNGSRIAYITPSAAAQGSLRWAVMQVDDRATHYLADFRPTQEQLTCFMFFDQYGQSHSPWSPDGSHLMFSGALGYERVRSPLPVGRSASVLSADVNGDNPPQAVAQGFLGFWSPV